MSYPPWFKEPPSWSGGNGAAGAKGLENRMIQLHLEILEFNERMSPTQEEHRIRTAAVRRVAEVARSLWPNSEVKVFGSFATGLFLPTSDIDVVILNSGGSGPIVSRLRALEAQLKRANIASKVDVRGKAKVPIMIFEERQSGLAFDASLETRKEVEAAEMMKAAVRENPWMAPLYRVLKMFFQQKRLNEVYHTGGMNSYTVFVMLRFFLQIHPASYTVGMENQKLGVLLLGFFHLYGHSLNVREYGISCLHGGRFLRKSELGFVDLKPFLLAAQDPLVSTNDVGRNSFNFPYIQQTFRDAYHHLTCTSHPSLAHILSN